MSYIFFIRSIFVFKFVTTVSSHSILKLDSIKKLYWIIISTKVCVREKGIQMFEWKFNIQHELTTIFVRSGHKSSKNKTLGINTSSVNERSRRRTKKETETQRKQNNNVGRLRCRHKKNKGDPKKRSGAALRWNPREGCSELDGASALKNNGTPFCFVDIYRSVLLPLMPEKFEPYIEN